MKRRNVLVAAACAVTSLVGFAQDSWPNKPIRVIVPYAPGGVVDVQTRLVTQRMAQELGQAIVVEARPGASANIGAEVVARSPADGYTLLVSAAFIINNPILTPNLRWKPADFVPVSRFALSPSYFAVPTSLGVNTVKEFAALARRAKPTMQYGDGGTGTPQTMASEVFRLTADVPLEGVMYQGAPPIVPDLANGLVSMAVLPSTVTQSAIQTGKIKAIAIISSNRSTQLPDVPTIAEAGFPEATVISFYGFHAPVGTPVAVIKRLEAAVRVATAAEEVKTRLVGAGGESAFMGQDDFKAFIESDTERWKKLIALIKR